MLCASTGNVWPLPWKCWDFGPPGCSISYTRLAHTVVCSSSVVGLNYWSCRFPQQLTPTCVLLWRGQGAGRGGGGHPQSSQVWSSVNTSGAVFAPTCGTLLKSIYCFSEWILRYCYRIPDRLKRWPSVHGSEHLIVLSQQPPPRHQTVQGASSFLAGWLQDVH